MDATTKEQRKTNIFPFTKGEEIFNAVTHIVGASFALVTLVLMLVKTAGNAVQTVSVVIYGVCMLLLFTMSAIYHFLRKNRAKKVFRIFDYCSIFLLIAGTYTPYCLIVFGQSSLGYSLIGAIWGVSIVGITLNAIKMTNRYVIVFTQIAYIVLGWCVVFAVSPLVQALQLGGIIWLLIGGIFYTAGIVFFAFSRRIPYFHPIWHIFVLLGAIAQFISVYGYVLS